MEDISEILKVIRSSAYSVSDKKQAISTLKIKHLLKQPPEIIREILSIVNLKTRRKIWEKVDDTYFASNPEVFVIAIEDGAKPISSVPSNVQQLFINQNKQRIIDNLYVINGIKKEVLAKNPEFCLDVIANVDRTIEERKQESKYNEKIIWKILDKCLTSIPRELQEANKDLLSNIVKYDYNLVRYFPENLQMGNALECMKYVANGSRNEISFISESVCQNYPDIYRKAIEASWVALDYIPLEIQAKYIKAFERLVEKSPEALKYIDKELQMKNPVMCKKAIEALIKKQEENTSYTYNEYYYNGVDYDSYNVAELKIEDLWKCINEEVKNMQTEDVNEMYMMIANHYPCMLQYLSSELQMKHPDAVKVAVNKSADVLQYVSPEIIRQSPKMCEKAVEENAELMKYVPEDVQIKNKQMCINILEKNIDAYLNLCIKVKYNSKIKKWMFGDLERIKQIKDNKYFKRFNSESMDILYHKMIMSIGFDEIDKLMQNDEEEYDEFGESKGLGVFTPVKASMMFSGMKPPYSEKFKEYYIEHRAEFLSKPEIYSKLSEIHNSFEEIINRPDLMEKYESGELTIEEILNSLPSERDENERNETPNLIPSDNDENETPNKDDDEWEI